MPDTEERPRQGFPVLRALLVLVSLWGSLWLAGTVGARVGAYIYETRYRPEPPYSEEQLRSMERASGNAAELARQDLRVWEDTVAVGSSVARIEGALAGSTLMLAVWGTFGAFWLWGRERDRALRSPDFGRPLGH